MSLNVPILFICYKRFDYVKETLSKILEFKPNKLYISIDGSRDNNDIQDVIEVKKTIEELLGDNLFDRSNVYYKIEEENLGCEINIINSINWVFNKEEEVIIIEEDVLVTDEFIDFIIKEKDNVIKGEYVCISKILYDSLGLDSFQFNAHGWYITKLNWVNTFSIQNIKKDNFMFEKIIKLIYKPSPDAYKALKYTLEQRHFHWDENFKHNIFLKNKKILYVPDNSTKHIGLISTNKDDKFTLNETNNIIKLISN